MVIESKLINKKRYKKSLLTIGSFDGIHIGHKKILSNLKEKSKKYNLPSIVITFDPHPNKILRPDSNFKILQNIKNKIEIIESYNIDYMWIVPFNNPFSKLTAHIFLKDYIVNNFNPKHIIIGYDHRFGFMRKGDVDFLNLNKIIYDYKLHVIKPVLYKNQPVSSTKIKTYLRDGEIKSVNKCLGYDYKIEGEVVKGFGIGNKMQYPTANIKPDSIDQVLPANGVYHVEATIDLENYNGMCNIGKRPTFHNDGPIVIEVHLFNKKNFNIYGKFIKLKFKKFLRKEKKYKNKNELLYQLKIDRESCFI